MVELIGVNKGRRCLIRGINKDFTYHLFRMTHRGSMVYARWILRSDIYNTRTNPLQSVLWPWKYYDILMCDKCDLLNVI